MSNFKYYRQKIKMSQKEVGSYLGITGQAYSNYENGKREADYETLLKLSELFETSIENLLMDEEPEDIDETKKDEVTFDDFTYAMYNESRELLPEEKEMLLDMAKLMKEKRKNKQ